VEYLRFCCGNYIFSATVPPWMAESLIRMIDLIRGDYGEAKREHLRDVSGFMRKELSQKGFNILDSDSHIIPIYIGDEPKSDATKEFLEKSGYVAALFKSPAVPKDQALIRLSICSDITFEEAEGIIASLESARKKIGF